MDAAQAEVLDEQRWRALWDSLADDDDEQGIPEILVEVVGRYAPTCQDRVGSLSAALREGRREDAIAVAHSLRGSSAMLGAVRAERLAGSLEDDLLAGEVAGPDQVQATVAALSRACEDAAGLLQVRVGIAHGLIPRQRGPAEDG